MKVLPLISQNKYDEAIRAYDRAIELSPQDVDAWNNNGVALESLGRSTEANAAFAKAKELGYKLIQIDQDCGRNS